MESERSPETTGRQHSRVCEQCGKSFATDRPPRRNHPLRFCSRACNGANRRGQAFGARGFVTPPSTKAERIRANGLVNKREKLGWFKRPATCAKCGIAPDRTLDAHHADYMQPGTVAFICRACHMLEHFHPGYLAGVPTVCIDVPDDGHPIGHGPRHHKGGRKGPTGRAKGKSPSMTVVRAVEVDGAVTETLSCGHTFTRPAAEPFKKQRRCVPCRDGNCPLPGRRWTGGRKRLPTARGVVKVSLANTPCAAPIPESEVAA